MPLLNTQKIIEENEKDYHDFYFEECKYEKREQGFQACKNHHLSAQKKLIEGIVKDLENMKAPKALFLEDINIYNKAISKIQEDLKNLIKKI